METEKEYKSGDEIRLQVILDAFYSSGLRSKDVADPDKQIAQWLRIGIMRLEKGESLTIASLKDIDAMGGTDHLDPTLTTSK
jgi:hypothetical protein